jgi:uncharacterized membrane protein (DUF106 family)
MEASQRTTVLVVLVAGVVIGLIAGWLVFRNTHAPDNSAAELQERMREYQKDSTSHARQQIELKQQIDSLTAVKQQIQTRYVTKIHTIYYMPDSLVSQLLAKHLDSLYIHRFNGFTAQ